MEKYKGADFLFIIIFCFLLFIPMLDVCKKNKSVYENRFLSAKPVLINNNKFNSSFGVDFNKYFSDRFNFRNQLIYADTLLKCSVNTTFCSKNDITFDKVNHVMYNKGFWGLSLKNDFKQLQYSFIIENLNRFSEYCNKNNIKFYMLIIPRRADFVRNYNTYSNIPDDDAVELINNIKLLTDINVLFPYDDMLKQNESTPVYYKTDHHWTHAGAYVAYLSLMNQIKKVYPDIKILSDIDFDNYYNVKVKTILTYKFHTGKLFSNFWLYPDKHEEILQTKYKYYRYKNFDDISVIKNSTLPAFNNKTDYETYYLNGYDKKILVIGDSFTGFLLEFIPFTFKNTVFYSANYRFFNIRNYQKLINTYKPDIIVFVMRSFYMNTLYYMYNDKYYIN